MWFADMRINPGAAYYPFIKLVLARFQPYSITGFELSPVVFADFAQLAPERSASIQWSTGLRGTTQLTVTVTGQTYSDSHVSKFHEGKKATVTAQFEKQLTSQSDDENHPTGWLPVGSEVELTKQGLSAIMIIAGITSSTWTRNAHLSERGRDVPARPSRVRVVPQRRRAAGDSRCHSAEGAARVRGHVPAVAAGDLESGRQARARLRVLTTRTNLTKPRPKGRGFALRDACHAPDLIG